MTVNENSAPNSELQNTDDQGQGKKKRLWMIGAGVLAVALAGGGSAAYLNSQYRSYEINVDGKTLTGSLYQGTVGQALEKSKVKLGDHDEVQPALDTKLTDNSQIKVLRAEQYQVLLNGKETPVWSTAKDLNSILQAAVKQNPGATPTLKADAKNTYAGHPLSDKEQEANFMIGGKPVKVKLTKDADLSSVLKSANADLQDQDSAILTLKDGQITAEVTQIRTSQRTETQKIDFETQRVNDDSLAEGETKVVTKGQPGERTLTIEETKTNGVVTSAKEVANEVTKEPVKQVINVGTKVVVAEQPKPAPEEAEQKQPSSDGKAPAAKQPEAKKPEAKKPEAPAKGSVPSSGVWHALAMCESGGNPRLVHGPYHGLYQFTVSTWRSVGGSGLPSQASPAEQLKRAKIIQARSGWGQWPACSRKIGVR
ncbi:hypothetical protein BSR28_07270 [Boudabousia liubingyangii]|uniref:resuscitation-promoting factor n=1 Tax=Boudabousia liubingyangii TaxID=1921764 RepID=UPI00093C68AA|nr:resuscitation-promoting factor [Boudabousia liubingyangii]OKL46329.1 hypothetical protein BSR28_07270 [Boudabousia liubingyangii]